MDPEIVVPELVAVAALYLLVPTVVFGTQAARGFKMVECPETNQFVKVRIDPLVSVKRLFRGGNHEVTDCSRWPERWGCDRACEACL